MLANRSPSSDPSRPIIARLIETPSPATPRITRRRAATKTTRHQGRRMFTRAGLAHAHALSYPCPYHTNDLTHAGADEGRVSRSPCPFPTPAPCAFAAHPVSAACEGLAYLPSLHREVPSGCSRPIEPMDIDASGELDGQVSGCSGNKSTHSASDPTSTAWVRIPARQCMPAAKYPSRREHLPDSSGPSTRGLPQL